VEDTLKAAITLMIRGKIYEGKTMFLNMLLSTVNLAYNDHIATEVRTIGAFVFSLISGR